MPCRMGVLKRFADVYITGRLIMTFRSAEAWMSALVRAYGDGEVALTGKTRNICGRYAPTENVETHFRFGNGQGCAAGGGPSICPHMGSHIG